MLVAGWVAGIVHAGVEIRIAEVLILVAKPKGVAELLADYKISPGRGIVFCRIKVRIINLHRALDDMVSGGPNRSYAKPAIIAVFITADFNPTAGRTTVSGRFAGNDIGIQNSRYTPVHSRTRKRRIPNRRNIIPHAQTERTSHPAPMIVAPRMKSINRLRQ